LTIAAWIQAWAARILKPWGSDGSVTVHHGGCEIGQGLSRWMLARIRWAMELVTWLRSGFVRGYNIYPPVWAKMANGNPLLINKGLYLSIPGKTVYKSRIFPASHVWLPEGNLVIHPAISMIRWRWNLRGSMVLVALTFKKCHRTSPFGPFIAPTGLENNCHTAENLWKSYEIIIIWMFKAPKECGPCSPCRTRNPHQSGASGGHIFGLPFGADPGGGYQFWGAWSAARGGDVGLGVNDIIRIHIYIYMWWIYSDFIWFYMNLYGLSWDDKWFMGW